MIALTLHGCFLLSLSQTSFSLLLTFSFVSTQFSRTIKSVQCDNGCEFDNSSARTFFLTHGVTIHMSCPHTSQQNGKVERTLRTLNNIIRSLLFQTSLPSLYWVEAFHTTTYLLNWRPSKTLDHQTPYAALHGSPPSYDHLHVFRCKCYPNTAANKLHPRSSLCLFLDYSDNHKGYRYLDRASNRLIIFRHVTFDESSFPFAERFVPIPSSKFDFLSEFDVMSIPIGSTFPTHVCAGTGFPGVGGTPVQLAPTAPGSPLCPSPAGASGP
jgi:hypothetical protein